MCMMICDQSAFEMDVSIEPLTPAFVNSPRPKAVHSICYLLLSNVIYFLLKHCECEAYH